MAHNKLICMVVKNKITEYSEQISKKLNNLSQRLERIYEDNERRYIREVYKQIHEAFYIEEAGGSKLPDEEDVLLEIEEDESYSIMMNEIDEKLIELQDRRNKIYCQIEQLLTHYENEDITIEKSKLCSFYLIFEMFRLEKDDFKRICVTEINAQHVLDRFIPEVLEKLHILTDILTDNNYFIVDSFNITKLVEYRDIYGQTTSLSSDGMILPIRGDKDTIGLNMYVEDKLIKSGIIEKQYFDYCIHEDEGYAMPEVDDYLDIQLDELSDEILGKLEEELKVLDNVIQIFESEFIELL